MPQVIRITVELQQTDGEEALHDLFHEAVVDARAGIANPAGTHVAGVGYYRVIASETADD